MEFWDTSKIRPGHRSHAWQFWRYDIPFTSYWSIYFLGGGSSSQMRKLLIMGEILVWRSLLSIRVHPALPYRQWYWIQRCSRDFVQTVWCRGHRFVPVSSRRKWTLGTLSSNVGKLNSLSLWKRRLSLAFICACWSLGHALLNVLSHRIPPYFLLYGRRLFFAFDFADKTWDTLDWHGVASTEDLLALWMQQILQRDKKLVLAMEQQKKVHQWAVDDFNHKHTHYL